ncbi:hypothetical protein FRAAL5031 [Frankia alni ACN14a]|uniref:Uncharacterized protein n=1 Tax=Frankia alni (strain DSM 45986 / CECT 9034 / ACN14a) TaxID=326424 RepID=Q0RFS0_FRAAA|nr:hypothetical protein FRAAL5031 [Frankia alni ACN14a]
MGAVKRSAVGSVFERDQTQMKDSTLLMNVGVKLPPLLGAMVPAVPVLFTPV